MFKNGKLYGSNIKFGTNKSACDEEELQYLIDALEKMSNNQDDVVVDNFVVNYKKDKEDPNQLKLFE